MELGVKLEPGGEMPEQPAQPRPGGMPHDTASEGP